VPVAERWKFKSFFVYSIVIGAILYPIFGGWMWGGGWLAQLGYRLGIGHGAVDTPDPESFTCRAARSRSSPRT